MHPVKPQSVCTSLITTVESGIFWNTERIVLKEGRATTRQAFCWAPSRSAGGKYQISGKHRSNRETKEQRKVGPRRRLFCQILRWFCFNLLHGKEQRRLWRNHYLSQNLRTSFDSCHRQDLSHQARHVAGYAQRHRKAAGVHSFKEMDMLLCCPSSRRWPADAPELKVPCLQRRTFNRKSHDQPARIIRDM